MQQCRVTGITAGGRWWCLRKALGCREKALQELPLNTFVCNHSCINKSLVLGLVFMGFTEKFSFQEDKALHLQLCY